MATARALSWKPGFVTTSVVTKPRPPPNVVSRSPGAAIAAAGMAASAPSAAKVAIARRRVRPVDPARFQRPGDERPGWWASPPARWGDPEAWIDDEETRKVLLRTIASLPPRQRDVITLRDVLGWSESEVCTVLGVTEGNERVLLHRARAKVRAALERHLSPDADAA